MFCQHSDALCIRNHELNYLQVQHPMEDVGKIIHTRTRSNLTSELVTLSIQ